MAEVQSVESLGKIYLGSIKEHLSGPQEISIQMRTGYVQGP